MFRLPPFHPGLSMSPYGGFGSFTGNKGLQPLGLPAWQGQFTQPIEQQRPFEGQFTPGFGQPQPMPQLSGQLQPMQRTTFNPLPFEGGLGGMPKAGPQLGAGNGLGMGFGKGFFGPRPFVPGDQRIRPF